MTDATPRRTQDQRVQESSERLLDAAVELFAEKGYDRTSAADIGDRAGYSRSMVRVRYGGKEQLLEHLLRTEFEPRMLLARAGSTGLEQVISQVEIVEALAAEDPRLLRAFWVLCFEAVNPTSSLQPWLREWLGRYRHTTALAFAAGQRDGSVNPDIDPEHESSQIISRGLGLAMRWTLDEPEFDLHDEIKHWSEELRQRIGASPTPAQPF